MATQAEIQAHREATRDIASLAVAELVSQWPGLPLNNPEAVRDRLADLLAEIVDDFGAAAAALGADWYEELRAAADVPGSFTAVLPDMPSLEQVESSASYAASALYVDQDKALADAAAIADRLVMDAARAAIEVNVEQDPADVRWARSAQPGACAFCAMLATRGPVYRSEETATRSKADSYHEHCGCVAVPIWSGQTFELPDYASPWVDAYDAARRELGGKPSIDALLAEMRRIGDLR